ncbi:MAG: protease SohB, partial [Proteobacteria bacterium]
MEVLEQLGLFSAQAAVIVISIAIVLILIAVLASRAGNKSELEIELLHKKYKRFGQKLKAATLNKDQLKEESKKNKKEAKLEAKGPKKGEAAAAPAGTVYVLDFDGDIKASAAEHLRQEVTAILKVASPIDEVVVRLESPGGMVHGYGLAASQLLRLREKNIPLTICIDKVAASGGYLMSCVGNKIL